MLVYPISWVYTFVRDVLGQYPFLSSWCYSSPTVQERLFGKGEVWATSPFSFCYNGLHVALI